MSLTLTGKDLSIHRDGKKIFSNLNFSIKSGELLFLSGSNGSGKTTLLRILSTLIRDFSGELLFNNLPIKNSCLEYRNNIVYVGHKLACFADSTVVQNLLFWAKLKNNTELLLPTMHFFDLHIVQDVVFSKLSAGWQKRVSLAKVLLFNAKIWLLDEPFTNLDIVSKNIILDLIKARLNQRGIVILSSHQEINIEFINVSALNLDLH